MILKEKNGIKLTLDRYLNGDCVFTVYGRGVDKLKWYGYQNERFAWEYFEKCINKRGRG